MVSPEEVDRVLLQVGSFGRFQLFNCLAINLPILFSALYTLGYVYTAQDLAYRCLIPECESAAPSPAYSPPWLAAAVPVHDGVPALCDRFPLNDSANYYSLPLPGDDGASCPAHFDTSTSVRCSQWVYEPGQRATVVDEWSLTCEDNKWKLSLVGTIGYVGAFVGMPLAGFVSDRFGRQKLLLWGWGLASLSGLLQSFSTNYVMFAFLEFCNSFFEAGVYGAGFLLAMEFVGPQQRVLTTTVLSIFYSSGNAVLGGLAYAVRDWRWLLRAIFGTGLVFVVPLWFTPESVRWLAARGRLGEADAVVAKVAAINKVAVDETLSSVADRSPSKAAEKGAEEANTFRVLAEVFKSRTLMIRFINCSYCWVANTFVYYGLSLNAVTLSGDQYVNFVLSGLVEIPANLLAIWLQEAAGRRGSLAATLVVAGASCLAFLVIPPDVQWLQVLVYMLGKFAITISFCVVYVITAEMFPTSVRQSMVSYGSTFGRVGSMLAPQTPLLASINESLPLTLFGVVSLSSGLLALLFPETRGRVLPETVEEAEKMTVLDCNKTCFSCAL